MAKSSLVPLPPSGTIRVLARTFSAYRWQIVILVILGILGASLDGIGINALIPLGSFLIGGGTPTDFISVAIGKVFHLFHIPFTVTWLAVLITLLFIVRALVLVFFSYVRGNISSHFLKSEIHDLFSSTLRAKWSYIIGQRAGYLQNTILWDVKRSATLLDIVVQLIQSLSGFGIYVLVAMSISLPITLGTMALGAVMLGIFYPLVKRSQKYGQQTSTAEKLLAQHVGEHLGGFKVVKASGREHEVVAHTDTLLERLRSAYANSVYVQSLGQAFFQPISFIFVIILFAVSYHSSAFSLPMFAAVLYLIQKIFTYLQSIQSSFHTVAELIPYATNMLEFRDTLVVESEIEITNPPPLTFVDELSFDDVSFSYVASRTALKNVSFSIKKGEIVGIIGPSGAGKTSVADLLLRLFKPTEGAVRIDNTDVEDISLHAWRDSIGYVAQDMFMFNGTIAENIRFYRPDISEKELIEASHQANAYDFIQALPDGFSTTVGDKGLMLSGGQRQRLALARALVGKPAILMLDEATSALDTESERLIHDAIYKLRGTMTVVLIAHRLSTVKRADRLIVFSEGKILEQGSPAELLTKPDSYFARQYHAEPDKDPSI